MKENLVELLLQHIEGLSKEEIMHSHVSALLKNIEKHLK